MIEKDLADVIRNIRATYMPLVDVAHPDYAIRGRLVAEMLGRITDDLEYMEGD